MTEATPARNPSPRKGVLGDDRVPFLGIILVAFALRLAYLLGYQHCPYFVKEGMDAGYNLDWARAMASGGTFVDGPYFRAPLYPAVLGILWRVFRDGFFEIRLTQMILGSLSCGLVFLIGRTVFRRGVAIAAGLACAGYWMLIYHDGEFLDPVLAIFLNLLAILALFRSRNAPGNSAWPVVAGLSLGLSAITRPSILVFAPFAVGWIYYVSRERASVAVRRAVVVAAALVLPIVPVAIRNFTVGKDSVVIASQGGLNFYIGNNPTSDGTAVRLPWVESTVQGIYRETALMASQEAGRALKPSEVSAHYQGKAMRFIMGQPAKSLGLFARKAAYFWSHLEILDNRNFYYLTERYTPFLRLLPVRFWLIGPLGLMGLAACWWRRKELFPLWGFVVSWMIGVILFFVTARFRLPVSPVLILLGAHGVAEVIAAVRLRETKRLAVLGVALLAGIALVVPAPRSAANTVRNKSLEMVDLASATAELGKPAQAVDLLEEAVRLRPDYAKAQYSLGVAYQTINRPDRAIAAYQKAVQLEPGYTSALNNLGRLLLQMRRPEDAATFLARAAQSDPRHATSRFNLGGALQAMGHAEEAARAYEDGLALDPSQLEFLIRAAWLRATARGALDCAKARTHAEEAVRLTRRGVHLALYTLAAAQASCGDFAGAIASIDEAIGVARTRGDQQAVAMMERQRAAYERGEPILLDSSQIRGQQEQGQHPTP